LKNFNVLITN